jgi:YD repeat-containing protein
LLTLAYNGAASLAYQYDNTQRITKVTSSGTGLANLNLTSPQFRATYGAVGLLSASLGNGLTETRAYNDRTWLYSLQVGSSGSVYSLTIPTNSSYSSSPGYSGNGDVLQATDSANTNWTYLYDDFNRLKQATNTSASPNQIYQYVYDRFGNRWQQNREQVTGEKTVDSRR